ncbi:MAG TPA: oligogalacturonate lyase family protein [Pirellulales bacterium]|nr:oligogalacturonate lyase family protein [Pirellulales bacterium]
MHLPTTRFRRLVLCLVIFCGAIWSRGVSASAADGPSADSKDSKAVPRTASASPRSNDASTDKAPAPANEPPTDWIDPATGHRILRLSRDPGTSTLYFHQNAYTPRGDRLFVTIAPSRSGRGANPQAGAGNAPPADGSAQPSGGDTPPPRGFVPLSSTMATIDLSTLGVAAPKIEKIGEGSVRGAVVGRKSGSVYCIRSDFVDGSRVDVVVATNLDTRATRDIGKLPFRVSSGLAVNADETLVGGSFEESRPQSPQNVRAAPGRRRDLGARLALRIPMRLFTINVQTGEVKTFNPSTDWLNHVQFSPTDPTLMMFCHEGPWEKVDRVWTIRTDGTGAKLMHPRTMPNEIAGHEFFGYDGRTIWYDLQTPRSDKFWLAGVNLETGERLRYPLERSQWSVHYNQSHDGKLFAGDGGGPASVANRTPLPENRPLDPPGNGMWLYLFTPQPGEPETMKVGDETVKIGKFAVEKLVDLAKHNYSLEPNLTFSPDNKWIIFRSNMHGPTHVYAVEVAKQP